MSGLLHVFTYEGKSLVRDVFIETGTNHGSTFLNAMRAGFLRGYSIEVDPVDITFARENLKGFPHATILHGSSPVLLPTIMDASKPTTFWLDAHHSGKGFEFHDPAMGQCPLLYELSEIRKVQWATLPLILIDDAHMFMRETLPEGEGFIRSHWPRMKEIEEHLPPGYKIDCHDNILYCLPEGWGNTPPASPMLPPGDFWQAAQSVPCYYTRRFGPIAYAYAQAIRGKMIIECGTGPGYLTAMLARAAQETGGTLYAIDIFPGNRLQEVTANLARCGVLGSVKFYRGEAKEQLQRLRDEGLMNGLGIVMIDDFHSEEQVYEELSIIWPLLAEGGIVMLHDTCTDYTDANGQDLLGVRRAVERIVEETGASCHWLPGDNGFSILQKKYQEGVPVIAFGT